jgi:hypothetical protein
MELKRKLINTITAVNNKNLTYFDSLGIMRREEDERRVVRLNQMLVDKCRDSNFVKC